MRHIDIDFRKLDLPEDWAARSEKLTRAIVAENDPIKRSKIIQKNEDLWQLLKPLLAQYFNYKCWYTEAPQQGTDVDVDHYRPKKRVRETVSTDSPHDGYWWLAFCIENYRFSCIYANRRRKDVSTGLTGGKADHFPVWNEKNRAKKPDDELDAEQPDLLDPLKATDVQLLTFSEKGEAMPRYSEEKHVRKFWRADQSIIFYNLNHTDFVRCRLDLRDEMDDEISSAMRHFNKLETGDADNDFAYEKSIRRLRKMMSKESPFSAFCCAYLGTFRHSEKYEGVLDGVFE